MTTFFRVCQWVFAAGTLVGLGQNDAWMAVPCVLLFVAATAAREVKR